MLQIATELLPALTTGQGETLRQALQPLASATPVASADYAALLRAVWQALASTGLLVPTLDAWTPATGVEHRARELLAHGGVANLAYLRRAIGSEDTTRLLLVRRCYADLLALLTARPPGRPASGPDPVTLARLPIIREILQQKPDTSWPEIAALCTERTGRMCTTRAARVTWERYGEMTYGCQ